MSEEIKPVAWKHAYHPPGAGDKYWQLRWDNTSQAGFTGEIVPLYALPATHRIVPVELLEEIARLTQWPEHPMVQKLRAIIDKVPT